MKKKINIHLSSKEDYKNKYNENILSYDLSNYILEETKGISSNDKIEFTIICDFEIDDEEKNAIVDMIRNCFGTEVSEIISSSKKQFIANFLIFFIGILFLLLYYVIEPKFISELTLILGWVFIGEAICNFLYHGIENRNKIKRKKQIINAKIVFKSLKTSITK